MIKVSILVPTMNRSEFIVRLIDYYVSVNSNHPIYIGDASDKSHSETIKRKISEIKNKIEIFYYYWPKFNDLKTLEELGKKSKEKYCAYIGDDDFLIPNSLEKCAHFLELNKDYRTAQGNALLITFNSDKPYGDKIFSSRYWNIKSLEQSKSVDRTISFSKNYWTPIFSVKRTEEFLVDLDCYGDMPDKRFGELISNYSIIAKGKSKFLDCLYLVRQAHDNRYIMKPGLEWIKSSNWNKSLKIFSNSISLIISKQDNIPIKESKQIVDKIVDDIITKALLKDILPKRKSIFRKIINLLKNNLPFISQTILISKIIKAFFKFKSMDMTHFSLIKKRSKYYYDFKPIYDIVLTKTKF